MTLARTFVGSTIVLACAALAVGAARHDNPPGGGSEGLGDDRGGDLVLAGAQRGWRLRDPNIVWTQDKVGINTNAPTARLDVKGTLRIRGDATFNNDLTTPGLRVLLTASSPNVIGGHIANVFNIDVVGQTIGGGGASGFANQTLGQYATVGGGISNEANEPWSTVAGGANNIANGAYTFVGGGISNLAENQMSSVGGGNNNRASEDVATVVGGVDNVAGG